MEATQSYKELFWSNLKAKYPELHAKLQGTDTAKAVDDMILTVIDQIGNDAANVLLHALSTDGFSRGMAAARELKKVIH